MLTSGQAQTITAQANSFDRTKYLEIIEKEIRKEAELGKSSVNISASIFIEKSKLHREDEILKQIVYSLELSGFKIEIHDYSDPRDNYSSPKTITVSWE